MEKSIHYLRNDNLDREAWDNCIENSPHARIYALSWYLDACTDQWDALVYGDYDAVMPLPYRKKWGIIPYVYLPFLCQQLGVFTSDIHAPKTMDWIESIPTRFRFVDYLFHSGSQLADSYQLYPNYLLDISGDYSMINSAYNQNRQRDLSKAEKAGLSMELSMDNSQFIDLLATHSDHYNYESGWKDKFMSLIREGSKKEAIQLAFVRSPQNDILHILLFAVFKDRLYYLVPVSVNPLGRETGAASFQVDQLIRKYAGKLQYFDFEGSRLPGVARFFESFGAQPRHYWHYKKKFKI